MSESYHQESEMIEQQPRITPTPWTRRGATLGVRHPDGGVLIMTARALSGHSSQVGEQEANAAYIVAAVNACSAAGFSEKQLREGELQRRVGVLPHE